MKFRYIGDEYTEWFGHKWMTGTEHDIEDEHAIGKLSISALFEKVEGAEAQTAPAKLKTVRAKKVADAEAATPSDDT